MGLVEHVSFWCHVQLMNMQAIAAKTLDVIRAYIRIDMGAWDVVSAP